MREVDKNSPVYKKAIEAHIALQEVLPEDWGMTDVLVDEAGYDSYGFDVVHTSMDGRKVLVKAVSSYNGTFRATCVAPIYKGDHFTSLTPNARSAYARLGLRFVQPYSSDLNLVLFVNDLKRYSAGFTQWMALNKKRFETLSATADGWRELVKALGGTPSCTSLDIKISKACSLILKYSSNKGSISAAFSGTKPGIAYLMGLILEAAGKKATKLKPLQETLAKFGALDSLLTEYDHDNHEVLDVLYKTSLSCLEYVEEHNKIKADLAEDAQ